MLENEITVVVCSRTDMASNQNFLEEMGKTCGCSMKLIFIQNQEGIGLTQIYHDIMEKVETNIVIFAHDDIEFLKDGWGAEILRLFNEHQDYGIIGVAGSAEFDKNAAWWNYKNIYGQVLHRKDGQCWLTAFSPLLDKDLQEVCVIDGLFMAVHKNRITYQFDKDLDGFHMYDIDFCLGNYVDGKTKIGVTTNIRLAHNSVGDGAGTISWLTNRDYVNDKFKEHYPINVNRKRK